MRLKYLVTPRTWAVPAVIALCIMLVGVVAYAQDPDDTSVSASCPGSVFVNNTISCTVTVSTSAVNDTDDGTPQGNVSISPNDTGVVSNNASCTGMTGTCSFDYTPTVYGDGSHSFNVSFSTGDGTKWNSSSNPDTGAHTVNRRTTSSSVSCTPGSILIGESSTCTVTVTDTATGNTSEPSGTVNWTLTTGQPSNFPTSCALTGNGNGTSSSCLVAYTPTGNNSADVENHTVQASFPNGDVHAASNGTADVEVSKRDTATVVTCSPAEVAVDADTTCTAEVTDASGGSGASTPAGDVDFSVGPGSGDFDPASGTCTLSSSSCEVDYTPTTANPSEHTVQGAFQGSATHKASSGDFVVKVRKRKTLTIVTCVTNPLFVDQETTCTARVEDNEQDGNESPPSGAVTLDDLDNLGEFTGVLVNPDFGTCSLSTGSSSSSDSWSSCDITYKPLSGGSGTVTINAVYDVDGNSDKHETSDDQTSLTVEKRLTTTAIQCFPSGNQALVDEEVECTVTVTDVTQDGNASGPEGRVVLSTQQDGEFREGSSEFDDATSSCDLAPSGNSATCNVKYNANTTESDIENHSLTAFYFDDLADAPGTIDVPGDFENLQKHQASSSSFSLAVQRRPTITQIDCTPIDWGTSDDDLTPGGSISCSVRVIDDSNNAGNRSAPGGTIEASNAKTPNSPFASPSFSLGTVGSSNTNSSNVTYTDTTSPTDPFHVLLAIYEPNDKKHLASGGTEAGPNGAGLEIPITTDNFGQPSSGGSGTVNFNDGTPRVCGDQGGGTVIPVEDLNKTILAIAFLLNTAADLVQFFPDVLVDVTDPINAGLETASQILELDSDSDGLVDVLEASLSAISIVTSGLPSPLFNPPDGAPLHCARLPLACVAFAFNPFKSDSDGDTIGDRDEILIAGGDWSPSHTVWPDPTRSDSDADGLLDGDEGPTFQSNLCDPDTDNDTLLDSDEISTYFDFTVSGYDISAGDLIGFQSDTRDQLSQLAPDTDGDGISDSEESTPGCNGGSDGFANDDDSDDDGLQDGQDTDADLAGAAGNDDELHDDDLDSICDPDSDGDGLLDGEEHQTGTDGFDWDSDDDGLSDREELQVFFTDPNDTDTDGDGADGLIEFRNPTLAPTLSGHPDLAATSIACDSDCEEALSAGSHPPFVGDRRDQTDPLQLDTDGDGIQDNVEFTPGCNTTGQTLNLTLADGFANSFDSDGDGASDGLEAGASAPGAALGDFDLSSAGDVDAAEGNDGELHDDEVASVCDPDSDGDGLLDGEEIGKGGVAADQTGPDFRDWDSDDDGLSDEEELNNYFIDPTQDDTDGDLADGVIDTRPADFSSPAHPALTGYSGGDTIDCKSDCEEVYSGTLLFNPAFSPDPDGPPAPDAAAGFGNPLDQTDPLQQDTDGDGINDNIEFAPGCNDGPGDSGTGTALFDGFANSFDSDADGLRDFEDATADVFDAASVVIDPTPVTRTWQTYPETPPAVPGDPAGKQPGADGVNDGELDDDAITGICDPDSDGDGLLDGEEHQIGTDPYDWDTDDDGRSDAELLGGNQAEAGGISSDPLNFDTDDDGLGDGVEVFGANPTNPVGADTDFDGLCDGGATTPASTQFGPAPGPGGTATGGVDGAGSNPLCYTGVAAHPNDGASPNALNPTPSGWGEDVNGDGNLDGGETNPNDFDTDDDAVGDGVELLAFYSSRQDQIPATDLFGRAILVAYPQQDTFVCMNPLNPDSDGDGLLDGVEDLNHDGIFDFEPGDFDHAGQGPIPGPAQDNPEETNPCDPDTDDDGLTDFDERNQPNPPAGTTGRPQSEAPFNPTNPLDHDTDNDRMLDGEEVFFACPATPAITHLDNDGDGFVNEDPLDGIDNDGDGLVDEDGPDFLIDHVDFLDPTNRDSDFDGFIDGLDSDPCNSLLIPILAPVSGEPVDFDGDGFADDDEIVAGTDPLDPDSSPIAFGDVDLDLDLLDNDRLWLEDSDGDGVADSVAIDTNSNVLIDARVAIVKPRDVEVGDFDGDGEADDRRYTVEYAFANQRVLQPRIVLTIDDYDGDMVIDQIDLRRVGR